MLELLPISFKEACSFINARHRHHKAPQGHKYSISAASAGQIIGVAIVGRPVARHLDDGLTLEVTRLCTDGTKNACSFLYAASWRVARNMGYKKLITYILDSESGTTAIAAGFKLIAATKADTWNRPGRPRVELNPKQVKLRFEICP